MYAVLEWKPIDSSIAQEWKASTLLPLAALWKLSVQWQLSVETVEAVCNGSSVEAEWKQLVEKEPEAPATASPSAARAITTSHRDLLLLLRWQQVRSYFSHHFSPYMYTYRYTTTYKYMCVYVRVHICALLLLFSPLSSTLTIYMSVVQCA